MTELKILRCWSCVSFFLVFVMLTCSLCENSSSFPLKMCSSYVLYIYFFKFSKNNKIKSAAKLKTQHFPNCQMPWSLLNLTFHLPVQKWTL